MGRSDVAWKIVAMTSGALAGLVVRQGVRVTWRASTNDEPPANPVSKDASWRGALAWAAISGVAVAIARLLAERGAAEAWKAKTGSYPAAVESTT